MVISLIAAFNLIVNEDPLKKIECEGVDTKSH